MNVYLAADHRGFELKELIKRTLQNEDAYSVIDLGARKYAKQDDYPDYAFRLGEAVAKAPGSRGIGLCGSGVGMAVAANKVPGVRAAPHRDPEIASVGRADDNTNILVLPADYLDEPTAVQIVKTWLKAEYSAEPRFERRIQKIDEYERKKSGQ